MSARAPRIRGEASCACQHSGRREIVRRRRLGPLFRCGDGRDLATALRASGTPPGRGRLGVTCYLHIMLPRNQVSRHLLGCILLQLQTSASRGEMCILQYDEQKWVNPDQVLRRMATLRCTAPDPLSLRPP